jgi:aspartate dehydrogenase
MSLQRLALIGHGAIGRAIAASLAQSPPPGHQLVGLLVRPHQLAEVHGTVPASVQVTADAAALLATAPEVVIEAAGHGAVAAHGEAVLRHGVSLMVLSVGALADAALHDALLAAARAGNSQLLLPVGAIAGLDGLLALRQAGLQRVRYTSTKPPRAWLGTPADGPFDLSGLTSPTVIFSGTARDAARLYPKNANLAAAVALAGLGFERTEVQLVADPAATGNTGQIDAEGATSRLQVVVSGAASAGNAKTSGIVAHSVLSALANAGAGLRFV